MKLLRTIDKVFWRLELVVAIAAMSGVVAILIAQVIWRYILQSPLFFAEELALVLMIIATFTGFSLMVAENRLIAIDMFGARLSDAKRRWISWFMRLVVLVLAAALAVFSVQYLAVPWVWMETSATLGLPRAYLYVIVTAELCILSFHQIVELTLSWPGRASESRELAP
ncbi:MAG: TRAP transporter small permease [Rhizobium rhizophilum]|uniref:TRAP transporter small permease n=1 Tax=Rhizobium rhizophilum TaxID=1850373 RepID=UPI00391C9800